MMNTTADDTVSATMSLKPVKSPMMKEFISMTTMPEMPTPART